ncbi:carboxymuconolactone decarboxylase family protein [Pseudoruegeria sp. SHC-113]|uniref:carboxymuconolactone decarboxylase family protein n=1 Tax=Pseudoruegeria sp. SHC-113 TaxID=2855439 RepID=UPI0021BACCC2|nr:carboxymuconolactone decarboxylase family protein [Pseudoruegeria sp. SHC-113]MCT8161159.1 carboxymuconolactone decarboxylase family protein [Pseudoruegeria sp. SHC-113]
MTSDFTKIFEAFMEQSQEMAKAFNPAMANYAKAAGFEDLMPTLSQSFMEMAFGKTLNPEGLDSKTRLLLNIAAMTVLGAQAEPQLKLTIRHALEAGASEREIAEVILQMSMFGGTPAMTKALQIAQSVFTDGGDAASAEDGSQ